jgi:predicted nucleic acid-binding protein
VRGILDTSVFVAREQERQLAADRIPDESAVSVVTLAELQLGVHMAVSEDVRARRLRTFAEVQATYAALPVDESVASAFAELVAAARATGRRASIRDVWIAATAKAYDAAVVTQDADFDALTGVQIVRV